MYTLDSGEYCKPIKFNGPLMLTNLTTKELRPPTRSRVKSYFISHLLESRLIPKFM